MTPSIVALLGFAAVTLLLPLLVVLHRSFEILTGKNPANAWGRDKDTPRPPAVLRMEHAHANYIENLVVFAAIVLGALAAGKGAVTDPLAMYVLYARIGQTGTHLISTSVLAVLIRATFYAIQLGLMGYMLFALLTG